MIPALEAEGLGKRYGSWALRDCTFALLPGQVTALVGPNGAGKSTLLELAAGLIRPTVGRVNLFGRDPVNDAAAVLPMFGFLGQDRPLYRGFTVADIMTFGRKLNASWDHDLATERIARLGLDPRKKIGQLSGGQQAQIALVLALAKCPQLLLLDEPIAAFDPLARREFLQQLMETVSERGTTVLLSSHILGDLERVCDSLIVLSAANVKLAGELDDIMAGHRLVVGPVAEKTLASSQHFVIGCSQTERQVSMLVRLDGTLVLGDAWSVTEPSLEEIVLAYLQTGPTDVRSDRIEVTSR
jgi:ABC-type multidrug transport system ATPase subunit